MGTILNWEIQHEPLEHLREMIAQPNFIEGFLNALQPSFAHLASQVGPIFTGVLKIRCNITTADERQLMGLMRSLN